MLALRTASTPHAPVPEWSSSKRDEVWSPSVHRDDLIHEERHRLSCGWAVSSEPSSDSATLDGEGGTAPEPHERELVVRGASIGRYLVLDVAGHGAMGVVYRAYDPELEREVAVKLLRRSFGAHDERSAGRLRREAQAMARVSHPNVLPVYDAGTHGGHVWIAMEYLRGETLTAWCSAPTRTREEIVAMFVQAARGLAAAHQAGVVHRDFKADNVLVGADGRARVVDFGLASAARGRETAQPGTHHSARPVVDVGGVDVGVAGTPRYMAPEQHFGRETDGRADQFAFCVALFEALYGRPPFTGSTIGELALRKHERRIDFDPDAVVPSWLRGVILRGLDPDPTARYPTMDALASTLLDDPASRRRRIWRIAGVGALVLGAAAASSWGVAQQRPCRDAARKLDGIWNVARGDRIAEAFAASGVSYAEDTSQLVRAALDVHAKAWIEAHDAACAATKIHGEQSNELLDLRIACFDRQRAELAAVLDLFDAADATTVERAVSAVRGLPRPDVCDQTATLLEIMPPPTDPATEDAIVGIETQLASATAVRLAGRTADASALAQAALTEARTLGYAPLIARAALEAGYSHRDADSQGTRTLYYEALEQAFAGGDRPTALKVFVAFAHHDAWIPDRTDLARGWIWMARGWQASLERSSADYMLMNAEALALRTDGDIYGAIELMHRALDSARESGADELRVAAMIGNVGAMYASNLDSMNALRFLRDAEAMHTRDLGNEHPQTLLQRANLGTVMMRSGDMERGLAMLQETAELQERALGPDDPNLLNTLNAVAAGFRRRGEPVRAADLHRRVLAARERSFGPDSEPVAQSAGNLATSLRALGRIDEARALHSRALGIVTRLYPPEHALVGEVRVEAARQLYAENRWDDALVEVTAALEILGAALGPDHSRTLEARVVRAELLMDTGQSAIARVELDALVASPRLTTADVATAANARFLLAKSISSDDDARAVNLANEALALLVGEEPRLTEEIETWLRERSP